MKRFLEELYKKKEDAFEFVRYCMVGGIDTVLEFGLLYGLVNYFAMWYQAAGLIAYLVGMLTNFFLNKNFSFRNTSNETIKQLGMFFFIGGLGLIWNQVLLFILVEKYHQDLMVSKLLILVFLVVWNYLLNRRFTFGWYK